VPKHKNKLTNNLLNKSEGLLPSICSCTNWKLNTRNRKHRQAAAKPALNRGCHLYSAGRPSRWALAHILVNFIIVSSDLQNLAENWSRARDVNGQDVTLRRPRRDGDVHSFRQDEIEMRHWYVSRLQRSCAVVIQLKFSAIFLQHLVPWPSVDMHQKFYADRSRGTPPSGELNTRGIAKYSNFGPIKGYISGMMQDRR